MHARSSCGRPYSTSPIPAGEREQFLRVRCQGPADPSSWRVHHPREVELRPPPCNCLGVVALIEEHGRDPRADNARIIELAPETVAMLRDMKRSNRSPFVFF